MINSSCLPPLGAIKNSNLRIQKYPKFDSHFKDTKVQTIPLYSIFERDFRSVYKDKAVEDIVQDAISDSENKIGEGAEKIVYQIPCIDYVVGKIKARPHTDTPIKRSDDFSQLEYNFGQPIATNGSDLILMKKVNGTSYSQDKWFATFLGSVRGGKEILSEQAEKFLNQIEQVSKFPLKSYVSFANQIKCLSSNDMKMDCFNPNNLLIDYEEKEINYIDIPENMQKTFSSLDKPLNGVDDMIVLLSDAFLNLKYLEVLDEQNALKLQKATEKTIAKCYLAAQIAGLDVKNNNLKKPAHCVMKYQLEMAEGLFFLRFIKIFNNIIKMCWKIEPK